AKFGTLFRFEGDVYRAVATHNAPQELMDEYGRQGLREPTPGGILHRMLRTKQVCHTADYAAESVHGTAARFGGARSIVCVPMLKDNVLIGAFSVYRQEVRPFTDKQIDLLQNFAAQAVIAIENARLLNELRQSLEQQTATADVLRVISSSPGELEPVFQTILENATRICGAKFANLHLYENGAFRRAGSYGTPLAWKEDIRREPIIRPNEINPIFRIVKTKAVLKIADMATEQAYIKRDPVVVALVEKAGARSLIGVPMLKEGKLIGTIAVFHQEVRPFTDKQIALVQNFATQAVIAIENTRLLSELRESLEQKTATSEVLSVISSSPANIQPVLDIIGERAEKLCDADVSVVSIVDADLIRLASIHGLTEAAVEAVRRAFPMRRTDETVTARAIRTRSVCHVADVLSDFEYQAKEAARVGGYHGCLGVPMVRDEQVVGAIFVARKRPGLFSDAQVQ